MEPHQREKSLIRKLINGTASKTELEEIQQLINTPQGRQWFDDVMDEIGGEFEADQQAETDHSLDDKLKLFKERNNIESEPRVVKMTPWRALMRYAAIGLLLISIASYFLIKPNTANQPALTAVTTQPLLKYQTGRGQRATITLSDGSVITLGPASSLRYPDGFTGNRRDVYLEGEAFFEVAKNPQKPFTVHSFELETRVVGTSFKIDAFRANPLEVSVVTGKVRVSANQNGKTTALATMLPGDHISWYQGQKQQDKRNPQDTKAWLNNQLIFNRTELSQILATLERTYDVKIDKHALNNANDKISVTLNGTWPLNRTMNVLAATAGFKYQIKGRTITLSK